MEIHDCDILVQELIPPIGGMYKYFAVIKFLSVVTKEGIERVYPDLGETHGKTQEEAQIKMQAKLDNWIAANN